MNLLSVFLYRLLNAEQYQLMYNQKYLWNQLINSTFYLLYTTKLK